MVWGVGVACLERLDLGLLRLVLRVLVVGIRVQTFGLRV